MRAMLMSGAAAAAALSSSAAVSLQTGASAGAPAHHLCDAIPGVQRLVQGRDLRWIVVGEIHGNNETPAAFADLVCAASAREPVVVAVEEPVSSQNAIDAFISSGGSPAAQAAFLRSPIWAGRDGRSSEAYFRLFETLRTMRANGRVKRVIAIVPNAYPSPGGYEELMANELMSGGGGRDLVVALVGNLHARLTPFAAGQAAYVPMAGHLPANETATLDARTDGGWSWTCMNEGCGPHNLGEVGSTRTRSIVLAGRAEGYTGVFYLGVPATPSPPAGANNAH